MKNEICPYLGQSDDPTTALGFPSSGNYCHRARPVAPVKLSHQSNYCLTSGHVDCPVYLSAHTRPLPAAIIAKSSRSFPTRQILALAGLPMIAIALIAAFLAFPGLIPQVKGLRDWLIPFTGQSQANPTFGQFTILNNVTFTPNSPQLNTPTLPPVRPDCPLPAGWTTYVVNPTDSFFRLSVVHNITVEALQQNNCMGKETAIVPGQVIYLPILPTLTPTSTPLPTKFSLFPTSTPLPGNLPPHILPATPVFNPINTPLPTATPPSPTFVNSPVPTGTPLPPTFTSTPFPTNTQLPTNTPYPTRTPRPTSTPRPTNTPKPTNTSLPPTATPQPTSTLAPIATQTPRPTKTKKFDPTATQPEPTSTPLPADTPIANQPVSPVFLCAMLPILRRAKQSLIVRK